jgi:DNA end-binding protein Ku
VRAIEIEQFVGADAQGEAPIFVKQAYYLEPEPVGRKAFSLLRAVLAEEGLKGVCKIVLKDREQLSVLDPYQSTMLLSTIYWPDEVRDLGELELPSEEFDAKPAEIAMAKQLVSAMTGDFEPERYHDAYREALLRVIEAKVDGQEVEAPEPVVETRGLTDLMAVLEASVAQARANRAGQAEDEAPAKATSSRASRSKASAKEETKEPIPVSRGRRSSKAARTDEAATAAPQRRRKSA